MAGAGFKITTPSRHPEPQLAYLNVSSFAGGKPQAFPRYRPEYVNPRSWKLNLIADMQIADIQRPPIGGVPPPPLPKHSWRVTSVGQGDVFRTTRTGDNAVATVPEPGEYEIELEITFPKKLSGEQRPPERSKKRFAIRDTCVVSLGDSYASGQGNPDLTAILREDKRAMCRATTALQLKEAYVKKRAELLRAGIEIGFAPLATIPIGKQIAETVGIINDARGHLENAYAEVKDWAGDFIREGLDTLIEGVSFGLVDPGPDPRPARWQEPNVYRSYRSGPSIAARRIETTSSDRAERCTFLSFARTGSEVIDGLLGPRKSEGVKLDAYIGNIGQIEEAARTLAGRRIDALLLSIGGNDIGFAATVEDMLIDLVGTGTPAEFKADADKRLEALDKAFDLLDVEIRKRLKPRHVMITEYPTQLFGPSGGCGLFASDAPVLNISRLDAKTVEQVGTTLNALIKRKSDQFGWQYIGGIAGAFRDRHYCASKTFFVGAEQSCRNQADFLGMLHPNGAGHEAYANAIAPVLAKARAPLIRDHRTKKPPRPGATP